MIGATGPESTQSSTTRLKESQQHRLKPQLTASFPQAVDTTNMAS